MAVWVSPVVLNLLWIEELLALSNRHQLQFSLFGNLVKLTAFGQQYTLIPQTPPGDNAINR